MKHKKKIDSFNMWMPINLGKELQYTHSEFQDGEPRDLPQRIKIMGIASTEAPDEVGEIIIQDGIDWNYFLKRGFLNLEHKQGPEFVMGQPEAVQKTSYKGYGATMLKGYLYSDKPSVKSLIETMEAMKKAGADRTIGLSVEGQVIERDRLNPKIIKRSKVLNVSITSSPCNADATMEIIKSMVEQIEKSDHEYHDKDMTHRQIQILQEYVSDLAEMFEQLPDEIDLQEWVQTKITRALDYLQASYHYMKVSLPEMMEEAKEEMMEEVEKAEDCPDCKDMDKECQYHSDKSYHMELQRVKKEMKDEDDHKIYDTLEMLLERYPELKNPDVMDKLHEMIDDMDKGGDPDDMTPSEYDDHITAQENKDPEHSAPDFTEMQSAKLENQADHDHELPEEEEMNASTTEAIAPITRQSLEDDIAYADYGMSSEDAKTLLEFIVRKYPDMDKADHQAMFMEMLQQMRRMYQTEGVAPKHPKKL